MTETHQESGTLILISVGPVQDFIAQARRTRDLWFGSHLLSEISRAVALSLSKEGAELIFPAFDRGSAELLPCDGFERPASLNDDADEDTSEDAEKVRGVWMTARDGKPPVNVSNKILALLPEGKDAAKCVKEARQAAKNQLNSFAKPVSERFGDALAPGSDLIWEEQLDTALEYSAAWMSMKGVDYKTARESLEQRLAGRKNLREFQAWTQQGTTARPKSSLDGARDSVLRESQPREGKGRDKYRVYSQYRISKGEQLDALGLTKRAGGQPDQFVPIARVALASWICAAYQSNHRVFANLEGAAHHHRLGRVQIGGRDWLRPFVYDAQLFFESRWKAIAEESASNHQDRVDLYEDIQKHAGKALEQAGKSRLKAPHGREVKLGEPSPYVACLVADGDRVGGALDKMKTPKQHRTFSKHLADFAERARKIVEHDHKGVLIYAGGDDVLAFVCLADAVFCADKLQEAFKTCMEDAKKKLGPDWPTGDDGQDVPTPTLSVGLGIGHILEGMGDLLELGRSAEKLAKGDGLPEKEQRNALGVIADKRSGGQHKWRARWDHGAVDAWLDALWLTYDHNARGVSSKKIYELRAMADRLPKHERLQKLENPDPGEWYNILRRETQRILGRSGLGLASETNYETVQSIGQAIFGHLDREAPQAVTHEHYKQAQEALRAWVDRMLIARMLPQADRATQLQIERHLQTQGAKQ